jgi:putative hydrolase of the HAD superfamily
LIFDVGRVIVGVNVARAMTTLGAGTRLPAEQVWAAIEADPRLREFQEGRLTPQDWHRHLAQRFGLELSFEQFCHAWNSALDPEPILSEDLFAGLAKRFRLVLLSNTDPIHVAHIETNFRFPRYFHGRVYSCGAARVSKPDPAIYKQAIREAAVRPEAILYVDDAPACVEAGRRAGLETILFRGAEGLLTELRQRGIAWQ